MSKKNYLSLDQIAEETGVSRWTVGRVVKNYAHVSKDKRDKVLQALKKHNYFPNSLTHGLKDGKTRLIGIIISNLDNPFILKIFQGIESVFQSQERHSLLGLSGESWDLCNKYVRDFLGRRVDGLIILPPHPRDDRTPDISLFNQIRKMKIPVVFLDYTPEGVSGFSQVSTDHRKGAESIVDHLIEKHGCKKILYFYDWPIPSLLARLEGYKDSLSKHGIRFTEDRVIKIGMDITPEDYALALEKARDADALFCCNDGFASMLINHFTSHGLRVPEDIVVAGFDNMPFVSNTGMGFTTAAQDMEAIGKSAASLVLGNGSGKKTSGQTIHIGTKLITRQSCGCNEKHD